MSTRTNRFVGDTLELTKLQKRLALLARASEWAAKRDQMQNNGADHRTQIAPKDKTFFNEAAQEDCYLWMLNRKCQTLSTAVDFDTITAWYRNLVTSLALVLDIINDSKANNSQLTQCLTLVAKSQAALRRAIAERAGYADQNQEAVFRWLQSFTQENKLVVRSGMKLTDLINVSDHASVAESIQAEGNSFQKTRMRRQTLALIGQKASAIRAATSEAESLWGDLIALVENAERIGLPPNAKDLRMALLPIGKLRPSQQLLPDYFRQVIETTAAFKQNQPTQKPSPKSATATNEIRKASRLLKGRLLVWIGSTDQKLQEKLKQTFGLKKVIRIAAKKHDSHKAIQQHIAEHDVAGVLLETRQLSNIGHLIKGYCKQYGKPLIRIPQGSDISKVARLINATKSPK